MIWLERPREREVEGRLKVPSRRLVLIPVEPDRGLADALHDVEDRLPLLAADRVAEEAPEQPDVITQGKVFVRGGVEAGRGHGGSRP